MKLKKKELVLYSAIGIILMFMLSLFVPSLQTIAKIGALTIYVVASVLQLQDMKRHGENIDNPVKFLFLFIIILGYVLFFL